MSTINWERSLWDRKGFRCCSGRVINCRFGNADGARKVALPRNPRFCVTCRFHEAVYKNANLAVTRRGLSVSNLGPVLGNFISVSRASVRLGFPVALSVIEVSTVRDSDFFSFHLCSYRELIILVGAKCCDFAK